MNLAETQTSVMKSRPTVPYGTNLFHITESVPATPQNTS